ncbi:MAG: flagellar hook-associated protein FlgK [Planctomycetes bacterium]|nr:flagellar hook-associated protein FlgK [Planctomycetota bacterium]
MSLFTSLQLAKNSMLVAQLGLQVTANNIANANTPGYMRQELVQIPAPSQRRGQLLIGLGVQVDRIEQQVDKFLEERLRGARSDLSSTETREHVYEQLEGLIGELGESDVSTALTSFFNAIQDALNQPESRSARNLVLLEGDALTRMVNRLDARTRDMRSDLNDRVMGIADEINGYLKDIADLNVHIVASEGSGTSRSDAVGLRDRRQSMLGSLAKLTDIKVLEQESGAVTVFAGGDYLVFDGAYREVKADLDYDRGLSIATIKLEETDSAIVSTSGEVAGLVSARDEILGGFLDSLDAFTRTLAFEFNKVHSKGQGLVGFTELTGDFAATDSDVALDEAGLAYAPTSGTFQVLVRNERTGLTKTTDIAIALNGLEDDTTMGDLAARLDEIDGLEAAVTADGRLRIAATAANTVFSFANDTSGTLAAFGLNTFFSGTTATDFALNSTMRDDPSRFAMSLGGIGEDAENGEALAGLLDTPLDAYDGASLSDVYRELVIGITQESAIATSVAEGFRVFQKTLEGQQMAVSGVSIDEEAVRMISQQRIYQMSAKFIAAVSEILETLVKL